MIKINVDQAKKSIHQKIGLSYNIMSVIVGGRKNERQSALKSLFCRRRHRGDS